MAHLICDTSPIQYLHLAGLLNLLPELAARVSIPRSVARELDIGRTLGVNLPDMSRMPWLTVSEPQHRHQELCDSDLGPGELDVLSLALERSNSIAVLDDKAARKMAESLQLPFMGTLGVLREAKAQGRLVTVRPIMDKLRSVGFYLSDKTYSSILTATGEIDPS
ncbi:MAG: DUF3368 domain-containing protein [Candidatus Hydrogenedentes bacterium]|nr:DUF3368 domain-containing protein [Candidatus Hydrogenedentota bacterium]